MKRFVSLTVLCGIAAFFLSGCASVYVDDLVKRKNYENGTVLSCVETDMNPDGLSVVRKARIERGERPEEREIALWPFYVPEGDGLSVYRLSIIAGDGKKIVGYALFCLPPGTRINYLRKGDVLENVTVK